MNISNEAANAADAGMVPEDYAEQGMATSVPRPDMAANNPRRSTVTLMGIGSDHVALVNEDPSTQKLVLSILGTMDINKDGQLSADEVVFGSVNLVKETQKMEKEKFKAEQDKFKAEQDKFKAEQDKDKAEQDSRAMEQKKVKAEQDSSMYKKGFLACVSTILVLMGGAAWLFFGSKETYVANGALASKGDGAVLKTDVYNLVVDMSQPAEATTPAAGKDGATAAPIQGQGPNQKMLGCIRPEEVELLEMGSIAVPATLVSADGSRHSFHIHDWNAPDAVGTIKIVDTSGVPYIIRKDDPACESVVKNGRRLHGHGGSSITVGVTASCDFQGTPGSDTIHGTIFDDVIHGNNGDDLMHGNAGNDNLSGGSGNDHLYGGEGNDFLVGGYGEDNYYPGLGNDVIHGGGTVHFSGLKGDYSFELGTIPDAYNIYFAGADALFVISTDGGTNTISLAYTTEWNLRFDDYTCDYHVTKPGVDSFTDSFDNGSGLVCTCTPKYC